MKGWAHKIPWLSLRKGLLAGLAFFVLASAYVIVGDLYVNWRAHDVHEATRMQMFKGLGFMALAALFVVGLQSVNHAWRLRGQNQILSADRRSLAGVLAASTAHDISNMLTSAMLDVDMIERGVAVPETAAHLKKSLVEIARLSRNLRDFGKDQLSFKMKPMDLAAVIGEAVGASHEHPHLRGARIEVDLQPGLMGSCEMSQIQQMILNLLLNSAEAKEYALIRVRLHRSQNQAVLEVDDDGPGIPDRIREQIFEPFFTTKKDGTGLGLASVKAAVGLHHGTISLRPSDRGGACFVIHMPLLPTRSN